MKKTLALTLTTVALAHIAAAQTVPSLINYQGRLSDSNGAALPTADYQLTFRIYDTNSGGNLIWGPQIFDGMTGTNGRGLRIPVVQGYFNVMLGPTDVSNRDLAIAFNGTNRFVEVQVTNNMPISPRQWIVSAGYALNSLKLAGADWSAVFGTNDPVNGKIPANKLATNQVWLTTGNAGTSPGVNFMGTTGNEPLELRVNAQSAFLKLLPNGNLGIDTATPRATLDALGQIVASGLNLAPPSANLLTGTYWALNADSVVPTNALLIAQWTNNFPNFSHSMYFSPDGNVGVGKLSPTSTLDVNGTVTATNFSGSGAGLTGLGITNMATRQVASSVGIGGVAMSSVVTTQMTSFASAPGNPVSGLSVSLAVTGNRPVMVSLVSACTDPNNGSDIEVSRSGVGAQGAVLFLRNASVVSSHQLLIEGANGALILRIPPATCQFVDLPPAPGVYTYSVNLFNYSGGATMGVNFVQLIAFEL